MKRSRLLGLTALVLLLFGLSVAMVAGAAKFWKPSLRAGAVLARVASRLVFQDRAPLAFSPPLPVFVAAASGYGTFIDDADGEAWALVEPGHDGQTTLNASGHHPDLDELTRHDRRPLLWFVRDGEEWVSRDPSVIARAREILEPMQRIGREMGEVGRRMGAHGAALGRLGGRLGRLGGRLAALETRAAFAPDGERQELRRKARAVRTEMESISAKMHDRDDSGDSGLKDRMRELGRRQRKAVREARASMRSLIEDAVRDHRARRLGIEI